MNIYEMTSQNQENKIYFKFKGNKENKNDDNNVVNIINNIFKKDSVEKYYNDVNLFVTDIRKILVDFNELELDIEIYKNNEKTTEIKIKDKKVIKYKSVNDLVINGEKFIFNFSNNKIITNFDCSLKNTKKILDIMNNEIKQIEKINKMELQKPNIYRNEKTIIKLYKLFYDRDIDFSSDTVYNELCIMLLILNRYDISTSEIYYEIVNNKILSSEIADLVNQLKYYGKITDNSVEIRKDIIKIIEIIKSEINNLIETKNYDELNKIAICSYFTDPYTSSDVDAIMKHSRIRDCYDSDEIDKTYKLIKQTDNKIRNKE